MLQSNRSTPKPRIARKIYDYATNIDGGSDGGSVVIPSGAIAIDFVCDQDDGWYQITPDKGEYCQYRGIHQWTRPQTAIDGEFDFYGSYELSLPPNVSGHLCYLEIEEIGYPISVGTFD